MSDDDTKKPRGAGERPPRRAPTKTGDRPGFKDKARGPAARGDKPERKFAGGDRPPRKFGDGPARKGPASDETRRRTPRVFDENGGEGRPRYPDRAGGDDRPRTFDKPRGEGRPRSFEKPAGESRARTFDKSAGADRPRAFDKPRGEGRPRSFEKPAGEGRPRAFDKSGGDRPPMRKRAVAETAAPARKPRKLPDPVEKTSAFEGERVAKVMARAGVCSRRDAEIWIEEGRVAVNGQRLTSAAFNVKDDDVITLDGKPLQEKERTRLFLFHKPAGLVTSAKDPEGRPTVFGFLDERFPDLPRVISIGRLDINTEGLLLLTNDGGLARALELPATGWTRRYRVRAHGEVNEAALQGLAAGVTIDDIHYAPIDARLDRTQGSNAWLTMALTEGKNREIKRVLEHIGLDVARLIRLSYGPFQLGDLAEGAVEEVKLKTLREQLGKGIAELAGVDFASPLREEQTPTEAQELRKRVDNRPRKHVSVLREQREEMAEGPRVKIERSATADRRGRAVTVERVRSAAPKEEPVKTRNSRRFAAAERAGGDEQWPRPERAERPRRTEGGAERPARRFEGPRSEGRFGDDRRPPRRDDERRPQRRDEGGRFAGARNARPEGDRPRFDKPRGAGGDRPRYDKPRGEGAERPRSDRPRSAGAERPRYDKPRGEGAERPRYDKPRGAGSDRPRYDKPRGEGAERPRYDKPRGEGGYARKDARPPRRDDGEARPPRRESGEGRPPRRDGAEGRPPRRDGEGRPERASRAPRAGGDFAKGRSAGPRKFDGDRKGPPRGGKPGGKPGGARPGGRPAGGKRPPRKDG